MSRIGVLVLDFFAAFLLASIADAVQPVLVSELRLSSIGLPVAPPTTGSTTVVKALAWSPDGKSLAAITGPLECRGGNDSLLVISLSGAGAGGNRIGLSECLNAMSVRHHPVSWCPASNCLAVQLRQGVGVFWNPEQGSTEPVTYTGLIAGFLDASRMLLTPKAGIPNFAYTRGAVIQDIEGGGTATPSFYTPEVDYVVAFGPPARALVHKNGQAAVTLNPLDGAVLSHGPALAHNPETHFGDRGRIVCAGGESPGWRADPMICYDISTGSEIRPRPRVRNGSPFDVARDAPVLLASDEYEPHSLNNFFTEGSGLYFKSLVVWDLGKGQEITKMKYPRQALGHAERVQAAKSALSPDGRRFAVGGDNFVRIYQIPTR